MHQGPCLGTPWDPHCLARVRALLLSQSPWQALALPPAPWNCKGASQALAPQWQGLGLGSRWSGEPVWDRRWGREGWGRCPPGSVSLSWQQRGNAGRGFSAFPWLLPPLGSDCSGLQMDLKATAGQGRKHGGQEALLVSHTQHPEPQMPLSSKITVSPFGSPVSTVSSEHNAGSDPISLQTRLLCPTVAGSKS